MNNNKRVSQKQKGKHLSFSQRALIEALLNEGFSYRYIALRLDCSPSTVSREVNRNCIKRSSRINDCANRDDCRNRNVCGSAKCRKACKTCNQCKKYCNNYVKRECPTLNELHMCNSCKKQYNCFHDKKIYKADTAQRKYEDTLTNSRNGFDLTLEQIVEINDIVSPRIKSGQSPYHIKHCLGDTLCISESTLRRMIDNNELDVTRIDLKEAVKRRKRTKRQQGNEYPSPSKAGRLYEDYLTFIKDNDVSIVEMDCVEGKQTDKCAILTLHFVELHLQLYYIMDEHTSECVVNTLDKIEEALGKELFSEVFELILTDNGHEFWDIDGMERSLSGGQRTQIFFCDPNRSDQKGACENNHKLLRCIIPKGTSIDGLNQSNMITITNHINSYRRKSLYGNTPYDIALHSLPEDFFIMLGLEQIPGEEVNLTPSLISE